MIRVLLASILLLSLAGCSAMRGVMVMDVDNGPTPVFKTTKCTVPNADGDLPIQALDLLEHRVRLGPVRVVQAHDRGAQQ